MSRSLIDLIDSFMESICGSCDNIYEFRFRTLTYAYLVSGRVSIGGDVFEYIVEATRNLDYERELF